MAILSSEVVLTGKDAGVAAMFENIGRKLDAMSKAAKISPEFDKLAGSLSKAEAQLKAIDKYNSAKTVADIARGKAEEARAKVAGAKAALEGMSAPTKRATADLERLQSAEARATEQYRRRAAAVLGARSAMAGLGLSSREAGTAEATLRSKIEATTAAMERQVTAERKLAAQSAASHVAAERAAEKRAHYLSHHGVAGTLLGAAAGAASVHGVLRVGEAAWEAGAEQQRAIVGMQTAGMGPEEIARARALATNVSRQAPNLSVSQILDLHKEARSAVQHPEEVFELLPDLAKAASVLKGMGNDGNIADLVKAGESLGLMNSPERFHTFLEGQMKAMQVFGRTISTDQVYEAAKYSKATGSTLSDDFLNGTMPSVIQEMHGSSAGDALSTLNKRLRGGLVHQHLAVDELNKMGLLDDPSLIRRSKTGEIIGYAGKVKGDALLTHDPGAWFQTFFKEGAAKVGAKSLEDINRLLSIVLPGTAANLGRILIQQEDSIRQHQENLHNATGLDETVQRQQEDWKAATEALKASLENMGAALTGPSMSRAAKGISWLSNEIKSLAAAAEAHPYIAGPAAAATGAAALGGVGYLSYQFLTAGTSLQTAATMLQEAAIKQGATPGALPRVLGAGGAAAEGGALAGGAVGLAAGVGVAGMIGGLAWLVKASQDAQRAGRGGAWAPATFATRAEDEDALNEQRGRIGELQARADRTRAASRFPDMPNPVLQQLEDEIADLRNQIAIREASLARIPQFPIGPMSNGNSPTMLGFGAAVGRGGGLAGPSVPLVPSVGGNAFLSAASPYGVLSGPSIGPPPRVDVTSHVETAFTNRIEITGLPAGVTATPVFQSHATRVSTGPSMPNAGLSQASPHWNGPH